MFKACALLLSLYSFHPVGDYNDYTYGSGYECGGSVKHSSLAFKDSERNPSGYTGFGYFTKYKIGVFGGLMYREPYGLFPFALPAISTKYVNIGIIPPIKIKGRRIDPAINFQIKVF